MPDTRGQVGYFADYRPLTGSDSRIMANLSEPQKREICEALAGFSSPATIIAHFRSEHGIELSHKQVGRYDPTRPYFDAGDNWREVFWGRRKAYLENVADVPIAHLGYRLQLLQQGAEAARIAKNWPLMAKLLEQAAREVGGVLTSQRELKVDDRRRAIDEMTSDERRAALVEIIRQAMEQAPARLAPLVDVEPKTVQ